MAGSQAYDPWGAVTAGGGSLSGHLGFQSGWTDPATGKVLMGARWYAPSAGDFTSADTVQVSPVPDPAAGDPFGYAGDDPLDGVDPTGHLCILGVCTPAVLNRGAHAVAHGFDVVRHGVATAADLGVAVGTVTVQDELKLIRQAAARVRDIPHVVADAASSGIRKLGSVAARAITYVRPIVHTVTAPVRTVVHLVKTAVHKAVSVGRKVGSAVRRAASATAKFVNQHATGIKQVAAAVGAVAFPALAPEALAVDAPFLQQHWRGVLQTALVVGAVGLTIANVLQLGLDPLTDAAEGADVGALAAGFGEEAASTAADTGATTAEEGASSEAASGEAPAESEPGPSCATPGGSSFAPGTRVLLASGAAIPISQLKPGEKVLATNTKTGKTQAEPVTAVLVHHDTDLYDLKIRDGSRMAVIDTTSSHLFWVPGTGGHGGQWVKAAALKYGTYLRGAGKGTATIAGSFTPRARSGWMWDLTVQNDHDFYIKAADGAVLVHNCPVAPGEGPTSRLDRIFPGPYARAGVSMEDFGDIRDPGLRELINEAGDEYGCHTCGATEPGTPKGNWVVDELPPRTLVSWGTPQTAFPQCAVCMLKQAQVVSVLAREAMAPE
jgi:RHS repeat-associated protein